MNWKKVKQSWHIGIFVSALMLALTLFAISWHNLDMLNAYAMLFNDINAIEHCDSGFLDVREVNDCGIIDCPDYQSIYIKSKFAELVGVVILLGIIIEFLIIKWKKKSQ